MTTPQLLALLRRIALQPIPYPLARNRLDTVLADYRLYPDPDEAVRELAELTDEGSDTSMAHQLDESGFGSQGIF